MSRAMGNECSVLRKVRIVENNGEDSLWHDIENLLEQKAVRVQKRSAGTTSTAAGLQNVLQGWDSPLLEALVSPTRSSKHFSSPLTSPAYICLSKGKCFCVSMKHLHAVINSRFWFQLLYSWKSRNSIYTSVYNQLFSYCLRESLKKEKK